MLPGCATLIGSHTIPWSIMRICLFFLIYLYLNFRVAILYFGLAYAGKVF
jgi:hypothetical protein